MPLLPRGLSYSRERNASSEAERKELADIEKKIDGIVDAIQDGAYSPTLKEKLHKLEARKAVLTKLLATIPPEIPDIHPNVAGIYRRKVARLAKALAKPEERDAAAAVTIRTRSSFVKLLRNRDSAPHGSLVGGNTHSAIVFPPSSRGKRKPAPKSDPTEGWPARTGYYFDAGG